MDPWFGRIGGSSHLRRAWRSALFAQIGLLAHLFSLLVPALGPQLAGFATGGATAAAIAGRTLVGWLMQLTPTGGYSAASTTPCRL